MFGLMILLKMTGRMFKFNAIFLTWFSYQNI